MKTSKILIEAKSLIDTPEKWTQGEFAKNSNGVQVQYGSEEAVCFCSLGALHRVTDVIDKEDFFVSREYLRKAIGDNFVADFNDNSTHVDVMAAWEKAIKLAQQDEE